jgi:hypothetical protein
MAHDFVLVRHFHGCTPSCDFAVVWLIPSTKRLLCVGRPRGTWAFLGNSPRFFGTDKIRSPVRDTIASPRKRAIAGRGRRSSGPTIRRICPYPVISVRSGYIGERAGSTPGLASHAGSQ